MEDEKHFSITDPKNVKTVIYRVNETEKEFLADSPKYTLERLRFEEQTVGENKRKTFFVQNSGELDSNAFYDVGRIGIAAGASVPDGIIKEVLAFLKNTSGEEPTVS